MKTDFTNSRRTPRNRDGSAVLIILVLLTILVALAAANTATVNRLRERVKLVDRRETARLASWSTHPPVNK